MCPSNIVHIVTNNIENYVAAGRLISHKYKHINWSPLELAIGRAGPGWPKPGRAKIGPIFSGQNFSNPARPKNRAGRAK